MSRWFRFYDDVLNDPKVQLLDGETFKAWINILCLASKNEGMIRSVTEVAFALRIPDNGAETLLERLLIAGLIDKRNGGTNGWHYAPHGWDKRQYKSDTSAERTRRYRDRKCDVTVTPPDTETDTEQKDTPLAPLEGARGVAISDGHKPKPARVKKPLSELEAEFELFWAAYPKRAGNPRHKARESFIRARNKGAPFDEIMAGVKRYMAHCISRNDPEFVAHSTTWLNQRRWLDDYGPVTTGSLYGRNFV